MSFTSDPSKRAFSVPVTKGQTFTIRRSKVLAKLPKRAALYVRVSTDKQTVQNQIEALTAIAEGRGWTIVGTYSDVGLSGAKGRRDRGQASIRCSMTHRAENSML
jgi:predicted site-specific integrase-resolvase